MQFAIYTQQMNISRVSKKQVSTLVSRCRIEDVKTVDFPCEYDQHVLLLTRLSDVCSQS